MPTQICSVIPHVAIRNNRVVTDSISVAEFFEKRHDDVLKKIRGVMTDCDPAYRLRNFAETVYQRENPSGGQAISAPIIELTRDAFVLIVMGFTGKKALQWKIRYIEAFNEMEMELHQRESRSQPSAEEMITLTISRSDLCSLCWGWSAAEYMREGLEQVSPGLIALRSPLADSIETMASHYKRTLEAVKVILERETRNIEPHPYAIEDANWRTVLHRLRQH